jgi:hypothetical protein
LKKEDSTRELSVSAEEALPCLPLQDFEVGRLNWQRGADNINGVRAGNGGDAGEATTEETLVCAIGSVAVQAYHTHSFCWAAKGGHTLPRTVFLLRTLLDLLDALGQDRVVLHEVRDTVWIGDIGKVALLGNVVRQTLKIGSFFFSETFS